MDCVQTAWKSKRIGATFAAQMAISKSHRREIGQRVKMLRERSGLKGHVLAARLHKSYRQVQYYENPGPGDFDTCERIAKLHWRLWAKHDPEWGFVSPGWLWDGKDRRKTPDVLGTLNGDFKTLAKRLDRIEERLAENQDGIIEILNHVDAAVARRVVSADDQPSEQDESRRLPESTSRGRTRRAGS